MGESDVNGGWFSAIRDGEARVPVEGNEHLTSEQRANAERIIEETAKRRGRLQAQVVVDVFENGEAVPQVQFPRGSTLDIMDANQVDAAVAKAASALQHWR